MEPFCRNYFHFTAWVIFNHYSVWLSSLSGLPAFLWWSPARLAAMHQEHLWLRAFLSGLNLTLLLLCWSLTSWGLLPVSVSRPARLTASHSVALDPLCSSNPSQIPPPIRPCFPAHCITHSRLLCCSDLVLPVVSVGRYCAFCAFTLLGAAVCPAVVTPSCSGGWGWGRWR